MLQVRGRYRAIPLIATSLVVALLGSTPAAAFGGSGSDVRGGSDDSGELTASAQHTRIKVTQTSGPTGGKQGTLSSADVNWEPPLCWYEPVFTPEQLKNFAENDGSGDAGLRDGGTDPSCGPTTSGTARTRTPSSPSRPR
ncbi:hypothetical protein GCM10010383_22270 [Streptomyces lomondensis]|uniref:Secreted protein n=1 Tax=Streptomyces lomondensis TaxID=68229 RepID=A0ABQ2X1R0_9ACTN|nr:hypothetical protein GCM10010383_22270 [Streptomyces lomondensis]